MSKKEFKVVFSDGSEVGDFPVAVKHTQHLEYPEKQENLVIDPIFTFSVKQNLYGRIMTLVEATTDSHKLKPVKDLFSKEIQEWANEVHRSADEIANGGNSSSNIYTR